MEKTRTLHYWERVRDDAGARLASCCGESTAPTTLSEVADRVHAAMRCGSNNDFATAIVHAASWTQADNEVKYLEMIAREDAIAKIT